MSHYCMEGHIGYIADGTLHSIISHSGLENFRIYEKTAYWLSYATES